MRTLFSPASLRTLNSLLAGRPLLAFDYDGTLSPIVKKPERAGVASEINELMKELCTRAPVAIVSGRSVGDLRARLEFEPKYLVGNHGLEGAYTARRTLQRAAMNCKKWRRELGVLLREESGWPDPGIEIEDKKYSLAVHYRRSTRKRAARRVLFKNMAELSDAPRLVLGKAVINVLPASAPHKGEALLKLMKHEKARSALYIGDDDTDEDVFRLSQAPGAPIFTVRVGFKQASEARYYLRKQAEIGRLLKRLLTQLP